MIRRYSGPRTFRPGWTTPFGPRTTPAAGFTTMPSPPDAVSDDHHAQASPQTLGSDVSAYTCRVPANSSGSAAASRDAIDRCQACGRAAFDAPSDASTWKGATRTPDSPDTGQQYRL